MAETSIASDTEALNSDKFFRQLDRLMGASIGVIAVRTREAERARQLLHEWGSMRSLELNVWTRLQGFGRYNALPTVNDEDDGTPKALAIDTEKMDQAYLSPHAYLPDYAPLMDALGYFEQRKTGGETDTTNFLGVFMGVSDDEFATPEVQQHIRDHVQRAMEVADRMVFILPPGVEVPDTIIGDVELIELDPPSYAELHDQLEDLVAGFPATLPYELTDDDAVLIVQNAMGMTEQEFGNAIALASVDLDREIKDEERTEVDGHDFVKIVRQRKLEILKQTQILTLMTPVSMDNVGGLDKLKEALQKQKRAFLPEARAFGIKVPKGFIVVGPPGGGKSLIAKGVGDALGIPCIQFDFAAVYNSLVGSSEARLRMCLKMVQDMAPCVLFIDEIEKAMPTDSGGDGGTSSRILGTFLTWLNDRAEKGIPVYVVAAANDVTRMPAELLRPGRFDAIWAVNYPSADVRATIFEIHVKLRGHALKASDYKALAKATPMYTGAEIEAIVEEALLADFDAGAKKLQFETVMAACKTMIPQYTSQHAKVLRMKEWVDQNARPASSDGSYLESDEDVAVRKEAVKPVVNRNVRTIRPRVKPKKPPLH